MCVTQGWKKVLFPAKAGKINKANQYPQSTIWFHMWKYKSPGPTFPFKCQHFLISLVFTTVYVS